MRKRAVKRLLIMICLMIAVVSLTACSSEKEAEISIDPSSLAEELLETVTSDSLGQTASSLIPATYYLDAEDVASAVAYASSGATSCEVSVIESVSSDKTSDVEENIRLYVNNQMEKDAAYNESEAARLKTAIIKSAGVYTVLCVCDDTDKAEEILKKYGF